MSKDFPVDEFDSVTAPGGRHRAKRTVRSRVASFARYGAITLVLSASAVAALNYTSNQADLNMSSGTTASSGLSGFNSNGLGVTVIDATSKKGLAASVANSLFDAGWNVLSAVNSVLVKNGTAQQNTSVVPAVPAPAATASATPTPAGSASSASSSAAGGNAAGSQTQTVVYVTTDAAKSAADSLLKTLGNYPVQQSAVYADPITIVLGSDYH